MSPPLQSSTAAEPPDGAMPTQADEPQEERFLSREEALRVLRNIRKPINPKAGCWLHTCPAHSTAVC